MWFLAYFLIHLIIYSLLRLEFLIWNWPSLQNLSWSDLFLAFLHGLRFDLSALALTVGLCLFGLVWLARHKILSRLWLVLFVILNSILFIINFVDVELYNYTAKRFTSSSFFLVQEAHFSNLILPNLSLAFSSLLIFCLYLWLVFKMVSRFNYHANWVKTAGHSFIILLVSIIFSRGGLQHKPISFVDAKVFENSYANNLILNSTFTILKSMNHSSLKKINYMTSEEMLALLTPHTEQKVFAEKNKKLNVVILVMESFSEEYSQLREPEVMPFFNKLRKNAVDFKNSFANGRRSIEGIASILSGIPALMEEPFISSEFSANQIIGLGSLLSANGYHTSFFHAANRGSMHFDAFAKSVGIQQHFSREDYPNQNDFDGTWGIFDEPFLNWTCEKITNFKAPFFATVFSLSSHHPFVLPKQYVDKFKDERLPILKTIQYSDFALEKFFDCAEKNEWFKDTLFIITADHVGPELQLNPSFVSHFKVPIVLYGPQLDWLKQINTEQVAQHIDILPTVLDALYIEQKNVNFLSRSLLRDGEKIIGLYSDGNYELLGDVKNKENQLKAIQQYFSQGLYDNRLYSPIKRY